MGLIWEVLPHLSFFVLVLPFVFFLSSFFPPTGNPCPCTSDIKLSDIHLLLSSCSRKPRLGTWEGSGNERLETGVSNEFLLYAEDMKTLGEGWHCFFVFS